MIMEQKAKQKPVYIFDPTGNEISKIINSLDGDGKHNYRKGEKLLSPVQGNEKRFVVCDNTTGECWMASNLTRMAAGRWLRTSRTENPYHRKPIPIR